jgi:hypothetical protein
MAQAGSTTLEEIGWTTFLKENPTAFKRNTKVRLWRVQSSND